MAIIKEYLEEKTKEELAAQFERINKKLQNRFIDAYKTKNKPVKQSTEAKIARVAILRNKLNRRN
jgi:hypothetical protein